MRAAVLLLVLAATVRADGPEFVARTTTGKEIVGPLASLSADLSATLTVKSFRRNVPAGGLLSLRRAGERLPAFSADDHLILVNGDRVPFRDLKLADEKLTFAHADLGGTASLPLTSVVVVWRSAPEGVTAVGAFRRKLLAEARKTDVVHLRNGDRVEGTLTRIGDAVELDAGGKVGKTPTAQVAAIAAGTDLLDKPPAKGVRVRVVVAPTEKAPGGRFTLTDVSSDGEHVTGKTLGGATLRVALDRVLSLDAETDDVVALQTLTPARSAYVPFLDEKRTPTVGATHVGDELTLAGSCHDRGLCLAAGTTVTYPLGGAFQAFDAVVGLDDRVGRRGRVRVRVSLDGKPVAEPKEFVLTHALGPRRVRVETAGAKELTLEILRDTTGPVQAFVDVVDPVLIR